MLTSLTATRYVTRHKHRQVTVIEASATDVDVSAVPFAYQVFVHPGSRTTRRESVPRNKRGEQTDSMSIFLICFRCDTSGRSRFVAAYVVSESTLHSARI